MNFRGKKIYLILILSLSFFFSANFCSAAFIKSNTKELIEGNANTSAYGSYETSGDIFSLVQIVINAFLSIIGVLLLIYMLYAGYNWMTAQGEEEKVTKAKDTLRRAIIGAIIIIAAYAISIFVMDRLQRGTLNGGGGSNASNGSNLTTQTCSDWTDCSPPCSSGNVDECTVIKCNNGVCQP